MSAGESRLSAWERRSEWPLTGLAVIFLACYALDVLNTALSPRQHELLDLAMTGIWVVFAVDFVVRLALATNRRLFFRTHLLDVLILLLPMARPLRALRVLTVLEVLNKRLRGGLHGKTAVYVIATTMLVGTIAALAVLNAERNAPHATITNFGDAVWWTLSTITTVGYGDLYPITMEGRIVAGTLMVGGIALLGVITGTFATWFVGSVRDLEDEMEESGDEVSARLDQMLVEIRLLPARVRALEATVTTKLTSSNQDGQVSPGRSAGPAQTG